MTALPRRTRVAALALTAALGAALTGCGSDDPSETSVATDPSDSSSDAGEEPSTPVSSTDGGSGEEVTVPVYFVGDTPQGPRLFREFRKVGSDNPLEEAAALMAAGDALDPDYRTAYPAGSFASIEYADGAFRVELPDDGWTTPADQAGSGEATLAVQQLVYTLQGVEQERAPITVFVGDSPVTLFGVDTADGVRAEPPMEVLGLVNVTSPEEGSTVGATFTASGVASSFEATVPWQVRQGDKVVLEGFATAEGWMDKLYPWESEVDVSDLPAGEYTFLAFTDDPSGGAEGPGPTQDTKTFTVE